MHKITKFTITMIAGLYMSNVIAYSNDAELQGKWISKSTTGKALNGEIELNADKSAKLSPEGYQALSGTWKKSAPNKLELTMPPYGTSIMIFKLSKNKKELTLTYDDLSSQIFKKESSK